MSPDAPPVAVLDEPVVVFIMVGLFAAAAMLAVLFATPLFSRVPPGETRARAGAATDSPPTQDDQLPGADPTPWSTTPLDD